MVNISCIALS